MTAVGDTAGAALRSPWAPLASRVFATLWLATVVSNIGTWMNDVGAGWLMTTLDPSPSTVALVQAATTLPVFLFALPAGALADIIDRRRLLLGVVVLKALVAAALAIVVWLEAMTVQLLLLFTFLLGAGAAFLAPAWQAIVPSLVPREDLAAAISLNSVGINVSRAIGPAAAGALIVGVGLYAPFVANALSFLVILAALWWWQGEKTADRRLPAEHVVPAMVTGLRYARRSRPLQRTIFRAVGFFAFASAYWAMLPLIARDVLGGGSALYGLLLGCVGAGAVVGAAILPRFRDRIGPDRLVLGGSLCTAAAMAVLAASGSQAAAAAAALLAGAGWIACLSSFQVSAQSSLPNWVRARGLSLFLTAFFGTMAGGSVVWGLVAEEFGIANALLAAAGGLAFTAFATLGVRLTAGSGLDLAPSLHWPAPPAIPPEAGDAGPVLVTIDYAVDPARRLEFDTLMQARREARLADGGYGWRLWRPLEEDGLLRESFLAPSWLDHLRQHERTTEAERRLQEAIRATLRDDAAPIVRHHLPSDALKETDR